MTEYAIRQLAAAVELRAVKDYFNKKSTPEKRKVILKDLRSCWMQELTNGNSLVVAEKLEFHPNEIKTRILKIHEGK